MPAAIDGVDGETANEVIVGAVTVKLALPLMPEEVAVIVAEPAAFVVTAPPLATAAILVSEDTQVED